jgi:hypothetical protein
MGAVTAAAATAGAVVLLFLLARLITTPRRALGASLVLAFGTPSWTVSSDALWTHGPGQLWLLLGVLLSASSLPLSAGLAYGAAIVTRPHYGLVAAVQWAGDALRRRPRQHLVRLAAGTAAGVVVLAVYNRRLFGQWGFRTGYSDTISDTSGVGLSHFVVNVIGSLVSPSRGVLVLTPFLLLLAPGLRRGWRVAPAWVRAAAVGGTAYLLVQLWLNRWSGGWGFYSYRLQIEWLTLSAPLLVLAYDEWTCRTALRRRMFAAAVGYSVVTHALGAVLYRGEVHEPRYWVLWQPGSVLGQRPVAAVTVTLVVAVGCAIAHRRLSRPPVAVAEALSAS